MIISAKKRQEIDAIIDEAIFGLIKISRVVNKICDAAYPTIDENSRDKFKDEVFHKLSQHFLYRSIYSPDTRLELDTEFVNEKHPPNFADHYINLRDYNNFLDELNLGNIAPKILCYDAENKLRASNPYRFSNLAKWLERETWKTHDGLLILGNIEPTGADINWDGYDNYMGVHINGVEINNASFFDDGWDLYSLPHDITEDEAKAWKYDDEFIDRLANRAEKIRAYSGRITFLKQRWESTLTHSEEWMNQIPRLPVSYYIEWALDQNIEIDWLDWAIKNKHYVERKVPKDKELSVREKRTLLVLIAALCSEAGINLQDKAVPKRIALATEQLGTSVSEETIRKLLKAIPDALESKKR